LIPLQNWFAPALQAAGAAGPAGLAGLLKTGVTDGAVLLGPMAEVVLHSLQYLSDADLLAMATYLQTLPRPEPRAAPADEAATAVRGEQLYGQHCAGCHGDDGRGVAGAYVPLAGNPAVLMEPPANPVQVVLGGAFAPTTTGNPRPFGMPPFATELSDADIAAVLSYVRNSWGNRASAVRALDVNRYRGSVRP
jgi:mono/diheme cytochrome c family protein